MTATTVSSNTSELNKTGESGEGTAAAPDVMLDFDKMGGLLPGVVQDAHTGEMLMLGFLNEASLRDTLESGYVTFWSRSRQTLWKKGETSGNRLRIVSIATDCDQDTLLFRVEVEGDGVVCHEGTVSCFTRPIAFVTKVGEQEAGK